MPDIHVPTDEQVRMAVDTVRLVPNSYRRFHVPTADVIRVHRIDTELLERVLDAGLACRGRGGSRRFDLLDVENLGLLLELPCPRRRGMKWWAKAFRNPSSGPSSRTYTLRLGAADKKLSDADALALDPSVLAAAVPGSVNRPAWTVFTLRAQLPATTHYFGPRFAPLLDEGARLQFHLIPVALQRNLAFLAETGLADCKLAAYHLVTRAAQLGLPVRTAEGLFIARPYASWHGWIEINDDGRWLAADPFFLHALARWGVVDSDQWPRHRSPQHALWRLSSGYAPLMRNGAAPAGATVAVLEDVPSK